MFPRWGLVVAVVAVSGLGTLGLGTAAAAVTPRAALLVQINAARAAYGLEAVRPAHLAPSLQLGEQAH